MSMMLHMKAETAVHHAQTESLLRERLFNKQLSQRCYCDVLNVFYTAYSSLESAIANFPLTAQLLKDRSKIELLKKDLIYLRSASSVKVHYLSNPDLPRVANEAAALGVIYVMEGSTLGGKIIISYLKKYDWMDVDLCGNFFSNYGDSRGRMWNEFGEIVNSFSSANQHAATHVVSGAKLAFDYIYSLLMQIR
ncbi:MAG TPA: biliverdin-producing heme oxygenase [Cellvibrio sp.]|nr:biliverdin-producing heme oxygenase [Cellvibrio sp.]